jgi:RNA processing factor Prp31
MELGSDEETALDHPDFSDKPPKVYFLHHWDSNEDFAPDILRNVQDALNNFLGWSKLVRPEVSAKDSDCYRRLVASVIHRRNLEIQHLNYAIDTIEHYLDDDSRVNNGKGDSRGAEVSFKLCKIFPEFMKYRLHLDSEKELLANYLDD